MTAVDQGHCDNRHEALGKRIGDLYEKANHKVPTSHFFAAVLAAAAAIGGCYIAIFAFSAALSANDSAIRAEIATVRLDSANAQAALRSDVRNLVTNMQALVKATEMNNQLLQGANP